MLESAAIEPLKEFSEFVSNRQEQIRAINPVVWDAATNTIRFTAFSVIARRSFRNSGAL
jgi:hypothetical protein